MVTQLREGVWRIDCGRVNAYLADDDGVLTLVDAGTPRSATTIRRAVEAAGFIVGDIERVLVTHYDIDHVGGLAKLGTDATIYMGASDIGFFLGDEKPPVGHAKGLIQRLTGVFIPRPVRTIESVADGDTIGSFEAFHTPGHTPGHTAYVSEELSVAFVGDLVMESDGELQPSPRYLSYDTDRVTESIHQLADEEPAVEVLAMGHGTPYIHDGAVRLAELGERIEI